MKSSLYILTKQWLQVEITQVGPKKTVPVAFQYCLALLDLVIDQNDSV